MSDESHLEFEWCGLKLQWTPDRHQFETVPPNPPKFEWGRARVAPEGRRWAAWITLFVEGHNTSFAPAGIGSTPEEALEAAARQIYTVAETMWRRVMGKAPSARSAEHYTCKDCSKKARWQLDTPSPSDDRVTVRTRRCDRCMQAFVSGQIKSGQSVDLSGWTTLGLMTEIEIESSCERCSAPARWRWDGPYRRKAFCDGHAAQIIASQVDIEVFDPQNWQTLR